MTVEHTIAALWIAILVFIGLFVIAFILSLIVAIITGIIRLIKMDRTVLDKELKEQEKWLANQK